MIWFNNCSADYYGQSLLTETNKFRNRLFHYCVMKVNSRNACCSCKRGDALSLNCGHRLACCSSPRWWVWRATVEKYWQESLRTRRKTCPSATLSTTNSTWSDSGAKPGLLVERPATNLLSHGTALEMLTTTQFGIFYLAGCKCKIKMRVVYKTIILHVLCMAEGLEHTLWGCLKTGCVG
jgi:hypothetical protein